MCGYAGWAKLSSLIFIISFKTNKHQSANWNRYDRWIHGNLVSDTHLAFILNFVQCQLFSRDGKEDGLIGGKDGEIVDVGDALLMIPRHAMVVQDQEVKRNEI